MNHSPQVKGKSFIAGNKFPNAEDGILRICGHQNASISIYLFMFVYYICGLG